MLLKLENIAKRFASESGEQTVLNHLNFELNAGDAVAITGPSGCGKSTLLNLIGALDRPTAGSIQLDGQELAHMDDEALSIIRADKIGFVFQEHHLLPQCSAVENILVPTLARKNSTNTTDLDKANALLKRVGLKDHAHKRPHQLSGGQRQRVAVVRALINDPVLLLADEPTGSLDADSAEQLADLLIDFNQKDGLALVVVTHALPLATRLKRHLRLDQGQLHDQNQAPAS